MLEHYFTRPKTVDRIRASWIAEPIERYVAWMHTRGYAVESVKQRVPLLVNFGAYALRRGARAWTELPQHVGVPGASSLDLSRGASRCLRQPAAATRQRGSDAPTEPSDLATA